MAWRDAQLSPPREKSLARVPRRQKDPDKAMREALRRLARGSEVIAVYGSASALLEARSPAESIFHRAAQVRSFPHGYVAMTTTEMGSASRWHSFLAR